MWRVQVTCQISTASVSLVASSIVAIMVARSKTSTRSAGGGNNNNNRTARRIRRRTATTPTFALMSSPYHRIIFGLSISDIFQSFGLLSGPFAAPAYVPQALWGAGNNLSCATNGIISTIGIISTPMYTSFLCYFCLCKVKKNMTDDTFSQQIERKLHKFIIAFNFMVCVAALVTKTLNSSPHGNFCFLAAVPTGCRQSPDIYGEFRHNLVLVRGLVIECKLGMGIGSSEGVSSANRFVYSARVMLRSSRDGFVGWGPASQYQPLSAPNASRIFPPPLLVVVVVDYFY